MCKPLKELLDSCNITNTQTHSETPLNELDITNNNINCSRQDVKLTENDIKTIDRQEALNTLVNNIYSNPNNKFKCLNLNFGSNIKLLNTAAFNTKIQIKKNCFLLVKRDNLKKFYTCSTKEQEFKFSFIEIFREFVKLNNFDEDIPQQINFFNQI